VWDVESGALFKTLPGGTGVISCLKVYRTAKGPHHLLAAGHDGIIREFDPERGCLLRVLNGPGPAVSCIHLFGAQGRQVLASGDAQGRALVWDLGDSWDDDGLLL
jgi:WD40 repeat protein